MIEDISRIDKQYALIFIPLVWGVWEIRKLRLELAYYKPIITNINKKIEDICLENLDDYPFLKSLSQFTYKVNQLIKS